MQAAATAKVSGAANRGRIANQQGVTGFETLCRRRANLLHEQTLSLDFLEFAFEVDFSVTVAPSMIIVVGVRDIAQ